MRVAELAEFSCVWLLWLYLVVFCCRAGLCRCGIFVVLRTLELIMGAHRLSYHGGGGLWYFKQVFTCFRTTVVRAHGTGDEFLPVFVPRWSGRMERETDFYLPSYHVTMDHGIFSKFLPTFAPRRSGCMEPEASFCRLSYHVAENYGIFCKYLSGLVPLYRQPGGTKGNTLRRKVPTPSPPLKIAVINRGTHNIFRN